MLRSRRPVDALVVGGGPAGSATALTLARLGKSVVVVERTRYEDWRPGESLAPSANAALADLGVGERLSMLGWQRCFGVEALWGGDEPYAIDYIFDPHGAGVQIERPHFDALLSSAAADAGAKCVLDARIRLGRRRDGWCVTIAASGREGHCRTRFVVDATGRRAVVARGLGARRETVDRLLGLVGFYEAPEPDDVDSTLLLEAVEDGWWYSAPLVGALVVAFMTDSDLLGGRARATPEAFRERLLDAPRTAARVDGLPFRRLQLRSASSSLLRAPAGAGWLAVGDAAAAHDPLSGTGLTRAIESGIEAGHALAAALDGDSAATERYARDTARSWAAYARTRADVYAREQRWPSSPFWARRTASTGDPSPVGSSRSPE